MTTWTFTIPDLDLPADDLAALHADFDALIRETLKREDRELRRIVYAEGF